MATEVLLKFTLVLIFLSLGSVNAFADLTPAPALPSASSVTLPPEGNWDCVSEQKDKTGELSEFGCKLPSPWACIATNVETCTEKSSRQIRTSSRIESSRCATSISDCL